MWCGCFEVVLVFDEVEFADGVVVDEADEAGWKA